jgi:hypothetical protein
MAQILRPDPSTAQLPAACASTVPIRRPGWRLATTGVRLVQQIALKTDQKSAMEVALPFLSWELQIYLVRNRSPFAPLALPKAKVAELRIGDPKSHLCEKRVTRPE